MNQTRLLYLSLVTILIFGAAFVAIKYIHNVDTDKEINVDTPTPKPKLKILEPDTEQQEQQEQHQEDPDEEEQEEQQVDELLPVQVANVNETSQYINFDQLDDMQGEIEQEEERSEIISLGEQTEPIDSQFDDLTEAANLDQEPEVEPAMSEASVASSATIPFGHDEYAELNRIVDLSLPPICTPGKSRYGQNPTTLFDSFANRVEASRPSFFGAMQ